MTKDDNKFITIVKEVERWAGILGNTAKNIIETDPLNKEEEES